MKKRYYGTRTADGVTVAVTLIDRRQRTRVRPLRHIPVHSPAGFDWGYHGSGPADLALAVLVDHLHERPPRRGWLAGTRFSRWAADSRAFRHHQLFKREIVAQFAEEWELEDEDIATWLAARTTRDSHSA
jgi:hypothetical protein